MPYVTLWKKTSDFVSIKIDCISCIGMFDWTHVVADVKQVCDENLQSQADDKRYDDNQHHYERLECVVGKPTQNLKWRADNEYGSDVCYLLVILPLHYSCHFLLCQTRTCAIEIIDVCIDRRSWGEAATRSHVLLHHYSSYSLVETILNWC